MATNIAKLVLVLEDLAGLRRAVGFSQSDAAKSLREFSPINRERFIKNCASFVRSTVTVADKAFSFKSVFSTFLERLTVLVAKIMEEARAFLREGVLSHLSMLEKESLLLAARQREALQQQTRVEELRSQLEKLRAQRDQLRAEVQGTTSLQQLKPVVDQENVKPQEENVEKSLQVSQLKARLMQVKDLLRAHHLIGGYDVVETRRGKGVCFSIATAFEGRYLETYNLEVDLARTIRICRHNVPPFIQLEKLAQQNLQEDMKAFLDTLSRHLNAFVGRREQVRLVQELLQGSVLLMETTSLYSIVVLTCTVPGGKDTEVLITLEYGDLTQYIPTRVTFDSEDKTLVESPQWKESQSLLQETPVHTALLAWKKEGRIC